MKMPQRNPLLHPSTKSLSEDQEFQEKRWAWHVGGEQSSCGRRSAFNEKNKKELTKPDRPHPGGPWKLGPRI